MSIEFDPDFEFAIALDVAELGVEFEELFSLFRRNNLYFHGIRTSIEEDNFFSVNMREEANLKVIDLLFDVNGDFDAFAP
jgi:hypothetical protein